MGAIKTFSEFIKESTWGEIARRAEGTEVRREDKRAHLKDENCTVDVLYDYLINNYEPLGEEEISLSSGKYDGKDCYEVHIPITLSGENIETELWGEDCTKIWSIDFTVDLMKYVERMDTVTEIDDENINSSTYARAYTQTDPVLCIEVVDFLDEILDMVPDPALKRKDI